MSKNDNSPALKLRDMWVRPEGPFRQRHQPLFCLNAAVQRVAVAKMVHHGRFAARDVEGWLRRAGGPEGACYRGADRLLQKLRKAGMLAYIEKQWMTTDALIAALED